MNFEQGVISGRICGSCEYSLEGLPVGSLCPECGQSTECVGSVGSGGGGGVYDSTMSVQAPTAFVQWIRNGFLLCMLSVLGGLGGVVMVTASEAGGGGGVWLPVGQMMLVVFSFCWSGGVWMITRSRGSLQIPVVDPVLDHKKLRTVIRFSSFAWPCWVGLVVGESLMAAGAVGGGVGSMLWTGLVTLVGIIAWTALIPACVYFAELAYWASSASIANRLRSVALVMAVFGVVTLVARLLAVSGLPVADFAKIVSIWTLVFSFLATAVFLLTVIQLRSVLSWLIGHQKLQAGRYARIAERVEKQLKDRSMIAVTSPCEGCGYDLEGLAVAGVCPECGKGYGGGGGAGMMNFPVRDPALDGVRHDETPIDVAEKPSGGIVTHRRTLGMPLEDVGDGAEDEIGGDDEIRLADD